MWRKGDGSLPLDEMQRIAERYDALLVNEVVPGRDVGQVLIGKEHETAGRKRKTSGCNH